MPYALIEILFVLTIGNSVAETGIIAFSSFVIYASWRKTNNVKYEISMSGILTNCKLVFMITGGANFFTDLTPHSL